jgi:hypothetical protein
MTAAATSGSSCIAAVAASALVVDACALVRLATNHEKDFGLSR